jgi:hypothetical protein
MLLIYGALMNVSFYSAFLTGLYQWRTVEFSMKTVPMPLKLLLSTAISASCCHMMHSKNIYNPELYKMAMKYRKDFDPDGMEKEKEFETYI